MRSISVRTSVGSVLALASLLAGCGLLKNGSETIIVSTGPSVDVGSKADVDVFTWPQECNMQCNGIHCVADCDEFCPFACSDNNPCTTGDKCVGSSCDGQPLNCDDGDPCTLEQCVKGACDVTAVNCDDGDLCTVDSCGKPATIGASPCAHAAACSDPGSCDSANGTCSKTFACTLPTKWGPSLQKISKFAILSSNIGCDLDGDGKPNNNFGKQLSNPLIRGPDPYNGNARLAKAIADGSMVDVLETGAYKTDGTTFAVRMLKGKLAGAPGCDPSAATCVYTILASSYEAKSAVPNTTCAPLATLLNVQVQDGSLVTSGTGPTVKFLLPLMLFDLLLPVRGLVLTGDTTDATGWKSTSNGMLCGVVTKLDLDAAIDALPAELLAQIGDAGTIKSLLGGIMKPDIDTNGDGVKDAISAAFGVETLPADVTGVAP